MGLAYIDVSKIENVKITSFVRCLAHFIKNWISMQRYIRSFLFMSIIPNNNFLPIIYFNNNILVVISKCEAYRG